METIRGLCREALYVGIDMDHESLRLNSRVNKLQTDAARLPFADATFDLITSDMVFEHLEDPRPVLREIERVLNAEGILLIHCACKWHISLLAGRFIKLALSDRLYRRLASYISHREVDDIFTTYYRASSRGQFQRLIGSTHLKLKRFSYLETPPMIPPVGWRAERTMRRVLPQPLKSTIVAEISREKC